MPGAPGMLSTASPRSAITSTTLSGGTPSVLFHLRWVENQIVLLRIQDFHVRCHELHHVFVATDDEDFVLAARRPRAPGCRSRRRPQSPRLRESECAALPTRAECRESGGEDPRAWTRAWPCSPRSSRRQSFASSLFHLRSGPIVRARSSRKTSPLTSKTAAK
jgi:hypothetical protein